MAITTIPVLPWQWEEFANNEDIRLIVGGFASGKSWYAAHWFLNRCLQFPDGQHGPVAKDLPQLKRGPLMTLKGVMAERKIEHNYNQSTGEIVLRKNGCRIIPLSAANFLAFRAIELDTIWADELGDWGPSAELAFTRYLAPRLRYSPNGKRYRKFMKPMMRITTNPTAIGSWLYKLVVDQKFCGYRNVSLRDNYLLPDLAAYIDRQERGMSKDLWPYLIDGNWGSCTTGSVYANFARGLVTHRPESGLPPPAIDMTKPLLWFHDFNVSKMCSIIGQHYTQNIILDQRRHLFLPVKMLAQSVRVEHEGYQRGIFYVLDEIVLENSATPNVAKEFIRRYGVIARRTGVILYGDASGGTRSQQIDAQSSARSNWAILVQALQREGIKVEFRVPKANPSVLDRINETKAQFETAEGMGCIVDIEKVPTLVRDWEGVVWLEGKNEMDKRDLALTHASDAFSYGVWFERTMNANPGSIEVADPFDQGLSQ